MNYLRDSWKSQTGKRTKTTAGQKQKVSSRILRLCTDSFWQFEHSWGQRFRKPTAAQRRSGTFPHGAKQVNQLFPPSLSNNVTVSIGFLLRGEVTRSVDLIFTELRSKSQTLRANYLRFPDRIIRVISKEMRSRNASMPLQWCTQKWEEDEYVCRDTWSEGRRGRGDVQRSKRRDDGNDKTSVQSLDSVFFNPSFLQGITPPSINTSSVTPHHSSLSRSSLSFPFLTLLTEKWRDDEKSRY